MPNLQPIEEVVGEKLLTQVGKPLKSTRQVLRGKELVGLYFGASWESRCQKFTEPLVEFYKLCSDGGGGGEGGAKFEIVYCPSDDDVTDFEEYYKKMPWCSLPTTEDGGKTTKANLITKLKINDIPMLVIVDGKTGEFVAGGKAVHEVTTAVTETTDGKDPTKKTKKEKCMELIQTWKSQERKPLVDGHIYMAQDRAGSFVSNFIKSMVFFFCLMYGSRFLMYLLAQGIKFYTSSTKTLTTTSSEL